MNKFKKLIFSLILVLVCTLSFKYDILAEETNKEEYYIEVTAETGNAGSGLEMSLEGFDKEEAYTNDYDYFIKFVKNETENG